MVWKTFSRLISAQKATPRKKAAPRSADARWEAQRRKLEVDSAVDRAQWFVDIINSNMKQANEAKVIRHRRSSLSSAKQRLSDLKQLIAENDFLSFENLDQIERQLAEIELETDQMEEGEQGSSLKEFLKLPLSLQCEALSLPLEVAVLERTDKQWVVSGKNYKRPEDAALAHFQSLGWQGVACEGKAVLLLMKAACLDTLTRVNEFGSRTDASISSFEGQAFIHKDHEIKILSDIGSAGVDLIRKNLQDIFSQPNYSMLYPDLDLEVMLDLWRAITPTDLKLFAKHIFEEHGYRAGWPDLTLVRQGQLRFVEVKTTDKLHASQRQLVLDILQPNSFDVHVIRLKKKS